MPPKKLVMPLPPQNLDRILIDSYKSCIEDAEINPMQALENLKNRPNTREENKPLMIQAYNELLAEHMQAKKKTRMKPLNEVYFMDD